MGADAASEADDDKPEENTYKDTAELGELLCTSFSPLGLPELADQDLDHLDAAIQLLTPPTAQIRVVEIDTFTESELSIAKGSIPLNRGSFSLRQLAIIAKRVPDDIEAAPISGSTPGVKEAPASTVAEPAEADVAAEELGRGSVKLAAAGFDAAVSPRGIRNEDVDWHEIPEIIVFWGRNRRRGGNLIVCPDQSMDRLIEAYLVCELVEHSTRLQGDGFMAAPRGALLGVEIGEASPAEQDALDSLISEYSYHDASVGVISLAASIYYFGFMGRNDVNVLTLLAVAVVAGLNQEATWPWVFKLILEFSSIKDPMVRVAQCRRVHHHQGQLSGQGFLAIGLAAFGVYLEVVPTEDGHTPIIFRVLLNLFQGGMLVILVVNMVQAVEPIITTKHRTNDLLRKWARLYLEGRVFETEWYLTLAVTIIWAGIIAAVVPNLPYEGEDLGWSIFVACLIVLCLSLATVAPGLALLSMWGLIWLIPTGLAFVLRSAFDFSSMLTNRVALTARRTSRELHAHVHASAAGPCSVKGALILVLQVLPLSPLLLAFVPIPIFYALSWMLHLSLRVCLVAADAFVYPISTFRMYHVLSDYGSMAWRMSRLTLDVEKVSMKTLLKRRVSKLMEGTLGCRVDSGVLPCKPYAHLNRTPAPRLGCIAIEIVGTEGDRALVTGKASIDNMLKEKSLDSKSDVGSDKDEKRPD